MKQPNKEQMLYSMIAISTCQIEHVFTNVNETMLGTPQIYENLEKVIRACMNLKESLDNEFEKSYSCY